MKKEKISGNALGLMMVGAAGVFWIPTLGALLQKAIQGSNQEQWLGFIGSLIGALATLLAAAIALFAAYKTIRPVKDQLAELIKQNDHAAYDRLRQRAIDLNDELILLFRTTSDREVLDRQVSDMVNHALPSSIFPLFETALDRFSESVRELQVKRGDVWGDKEVQITRDRFIDACLMCSSAGSRLAVKARGVERFLTITAASEIMDWRKSQMLVMNLAPLLYTHIDTETKRTRRAIGALEQGLFGKNL